jgi:hypothetical protein
MILIFLSICSLLFGFNSIDLLHDLKVIDEWVEIIREEDGKIIYQLDTKKIKYMKIEKEFSFSPKNALQVVQSIEDYNKIISNDNIDTHLIKRDKDTLFVSQIIRNAIPFISDRQYIFKMYKVGESRVDWYILNENDYSDIKYLHDTAHILTFGAGSWEVNNNTLIYKIYMDDEVNLPSFIIDKIRTKNIISIFEDVINNLD